MTFCIRHFFDNLELRAGLGTWNPSPSSGSLWAITVMTSLVLLIRFCHYSNDPNRKTKGKKRIF